MKASNSVRHIAIPCNKQAMPRLIPDIISCYSRYPLVLQLCYWIFITDIFLEWKCLSLLSNFVFTIYLVEAKPLFSLRKKRKLLRFRVYWLGQELCMVTYNNHNVRYVIKFHSKLSCIGKVKWGEDDHYSYPVELLKRGSISLLTMSLVIIGYSCWI